MSWDWDRGIPSFLIRRDRDIAIDHADADVDLPSPVGLPPHLERQRLASIQALGTRWLLHPMHAPRKATYNLYGMRVRR